MLLRLLRELRRGLVRQRVRRHPRARQPAAGHRGRLRHGRRRVRKLHGVHRRRRHEAAERRVVPVLRGLRELRGLRGLDIVGGDVVEVSPPFDPSGNTALVGATMMYEILCILAEATAKRKG